MATLSLYAIFLYALFNPVNSVNSSFCFKESIQTGDINCVIVIIVVPIGIVVIIIIIVSILTRRRNKAKRERRYALKTNRLTHNLTLSESFKFTNRDNFQQLNPGQIEINETEKEDNSGGNKEDAIKASSYINTSMAVSDLHQFIQLHSSKFFEDQFETIPDPKDITMSVGLSAENRRRNRYIDICAYDHSRVRLVPNADNESGYINASYVKGYQYEQIFIASQGPTSELVNDFVRMLWEQRVEKVVMLTRLIEGSRMKCECYWPDEGEQVFGEITMKLRSTQIFADYTIRNLELIKTNQPTQYLTHYYFTSWPDRGVPLTPWGLVDFHDIVFSEPTSQAIVVQCSAGVGRTGTFIALRNVLREAEITGRLDFFQTVAKLRQDRMMMIQTAKQYEFLHRAVLIAIVCTGTSFVARDINESIQSLNRLSVAGLTYMEEEFKALSTMNEDAKVRDSVYPTDGENLFEAVEKNNDIYGTLPFSNDLKSYREQLGYNTTGDTVFVNGFFVPSLTKHDQYILTQIPSSSSVAEFWGDVRKCNVSTIIVLYSPDSGENDDTTRCYQPCCPGEILECSPFVIQSKEMKRCHQVEEHHLILRWNQGSDDEETEGSATYVIKHVQYDMACPKQLLDVVNSVRPTAPNYGRVVFMCSNGFTYSGHAVVLTLLLDRMDNDLCLTVPLVVGTVKSIRPEVIPNLEQYRALYLVLQEYQVMKTKLKIKSESMS